jgi:hypothetical protein
MYITSSREKNFLPIRVPDTHMHHIEKERVHAFFPTLPVITNNPKERALRVLSGNLARLRLRPLQP